MESLGCVQLKGWDEALPIWQVIGENRLPTRFPGLGPEHTVALMGRNFELSLLHSRWQQALQRRGQLVMLFGEAGIGKSRTAAAFNAQIRETRHETLVYQCLPQRTRDPLHPIVRQIEFAAGFTHAEAPEHKLDKLEALLARFGNSSPERNDVFASLLSLPVSARCQDLDSDPTRRKAQTLAVLLESLFRLANGLPLVILLEDAQWIDPTTLELFEQVTARLHDQQVLLIITARPEFKPFWIDRPNTAECKLSRLNRPDAGAIIREVVGQDSASEGFRTNPIEDGRSAPFYRGAYQNGSRIRLSNRDAKPVGGA